MAILFLGSASVLQKMTLTFVFALVGTMLFMKILDTMYRDVIFMPLVGIMFGGVIGSFTTFIAYRYDLIQTLGAWMYGDLSGVLRGRYELLYLGVPVTIIAYLFADCFTLARMGEDFAVNYKQVMNMHVLRRMVNELGKTIVLVLHDINFASCHSDTIVALKDGKVVRQGTTEQMIDADALRTIYEMEIPIEVINGNRIGVYFA